MTRGDSAVNVRPLEHAVVRTCPAVTVLHWGNVGVRTAHRHQKRVVERESDVQNFAGVAGVALALAALGHARVAVQLDLRGGGFVMLVRLLGDTTAPNTNPKSSATAMMSPRWLLHTACTGVPPATFGTSPVTAQPCGQVQECHGEPRRMSKSCMTCGGREGGAWLRGGGGGGDRGPTCTPDMESQYMKPPRSSQLWM